MFFLAKGIFTLLSYVAPILIILSIIIDYTAIIDFGKFIVKLLKNNILVGILAILLTIVGFPFVAGFIFFRSIVRRKLKSIIKQHDPESQFKEPQFSEYEEIAEDTDFLELPAIEESPKQAENDYEDLFK